MRVPVNNSEAEELKMKSAVLRLGDWVIYSKAENLRIPKGYVDKPTLVACLSQEKDNPSTIRILVRTARDRSKIGFLYYNRAESENQPWTYDDEKGFVPLKMRIT